MWRGIDHVYVLCGETPESAQHLFIYSEVAIKGNNCADFLVKLGAESLQIFRSHDSRISPKGFLDILRSDAAGTFFLRE
ncbi:hypothetical protein A2U01_0015565 [Trifolium medium]|uniref:Uncharacterized protein n=1 Tax=Trifolium medium TaxID=97028 RepID=A0A392N4U7_9FABA|nr:hypothetical protein [Trifolium medium]